MTDGAWNHDLEVLVLDQLKNNQALITAFEANAANAIAPFTLTSHERNAFVRRASSDFVQLGVVDTVSQLPVVLGGGGGGGSSHGRHELPAGVLERIRDIVAGLINRFPRPPIRFPIPRPRPGTPPGPVPGPPGPDPPGPTPGPDPPKPNVRGGRG